MQFSNKFFVEDDATLKIILNDAISSANIKWNQYQYAASCLRWKSKRRPFLHVWPAVESALLRTSLNVDPSLIPESIIHKLEVIEVRFSDLSGREPFMLTIAEERKWETGTVGKGVFVNRAYQIIDNSGDVYIEAHGAALPFGVVPDENTYCGCGFEEELKLSLGILMLATDPEHCTPMLLNRDKGRNLTGGNLQKAIERAKRNGKHGFDIGASIEVSPHYRRPHFAIRWTGQGGKTPRLVPVKGSVINKALLGKVPTGYEDDLFSSNQTIEACSSIPYEAKS